VSARSASSSYSVLKFPSQHTPKLTIFDKNVVWFVMSFLLNIFSRQKIFTRLNFYITFEELLYYTFIKLLPHSKQQFTSNQNSLTARRVIIPEARQILPFHQLRRKTCSKNASQPCLDLDIGLNCNLDVSGTTSLRLTAMYNKVDLTAHEMRDICIICEE